MCTGMSILIPDTNTYIHPGCRVKLGRFESAVWRVAFGWFSWGGNRRMCGWYLVNFHDPSEVKPLYETDLDDIYLIEY